MTTKSRCICSGFLCSIGNIVNGEEKHEIPDETCPDGVEQL